jgi:DDE superfamily endonuclease
VNVALFWPLTDGKKRKLFLDNCRGHGETTDSSEALSRIRTTVRYLPPNSTHLLQPCNTFLIQKIKAEWRRKCDADKLKMIKDGRWKDERNSSEKLINPGKRYFLQLATNCVKAVNSMSAASGLSWSRKAMIRCGLSLGLNGEWSVEQLSPELREIIAKYPKDFQGLEEYSCSDGEHNGIEMSGESDEGDEYYE